MTQVIQAYATISLMFPIKDGEGKEITELNIRRAKVYDIKQMNAYKGSDAEKELYLLAMLTDQIPEDLEQLDIADYAKVQQALADMQKGKPVTSNSMQ